MALWTRLPRAEGAVEMIDGPAPLTELRECLSDVARLNAFFGGRFLTLVHVKRLSARLPPGQALTVLDVGTGGGDVPRALVRWARRVRRPKNRWRQEISGGRRIGAETAPPCARCAVRSPSDQ